MKTNQQVEEVQIEVIPCDPAQNTASNIAHQLIRVAQYQAGGWTVATRELAHTLAIRFHSKVLAAIDAELDFSQLKTFDGRA